MSAEMLKCWNYDSFWNFEYQHDGIEFFDLVMVFAFWCSLFGVRLMIDDTTS
jgi:hypothetical protein